MCTFEVFSNSAQFYLGYYTLIVVDVFEKRSFHFVPHYFLASYNTQNLYRERRKKREEKRLQLYLSRVDLCHRVAV